MRRMVKATGKDNGAGLLEMLGYIAVLGVVINLAAGVFISTMRLNAYSTAALDKIATIANINDEFAEAVRGSFAVSEGIGVYKSGADRVVLETPGSPGETKYIVLGLLDGARLSKLTLIEKDGKLEAGGCVTYRQDLESVHFRYDADSIRDARTVTMEIAARRPVDRGKKPPVHTFVANMRGDR